MTTQDDQTPMKSQASEQPIVGAVTEPVEDISRSEKARSLADRWVMARKELGKGMPLVMGQECYEYLGQRVSIVEVNMYDTVENAEVVIETGWADRTQVGFGELSWAFSRTTKDAACKVPRYEYIFGDK